MFLSQQKSFLIFGYIEKLNFADTDDQRISEFLICCIFDLWNLAIFLKKFSSRLRFETSVFYFYSSFFGPIVEAHTTGGDRK